MKIHDKLDKVQKKAVTDVLQALNKEGRALLQAATGTGKTNIAVKVYKELERKNKKVRILWLTHTNELVLQSAERFQNLSPGTDVGLFYGKEKDINAQVTVASIQSISKKDNLEKFKDSAFNYIFVDEAHHTPAETWERTLGYFKAGRFGFTATPFRPDNQLLDEYFGPIVSEFSLKEAQKMGVVAKIEGHIILTNSVIEAKFDKNGDYARSTLDRLWSTKDRSDIIVKSYKKYGRGGMKKMGLKFKTICYCINSHHASEMVKLFESSGISSAIMVGDAKRLKATERTETYEKFLTTHDIEVLCVVNILNEGADINDVGCMLMTRPTKSNIVYTQQIGRGVRIVPKYKEKVIVIDYVDNTEKKYLGYTHTNLPQAGVTHKRVVTEYLNDADPVIIERRVKDMMASIEEFENQFRISWTLEKCVEDAAKYSTRRDWRVGSTGYQAAFHNGWLNKCCKHMKLLNKRKYTEEQLLTSSSKYNSRYEWLAKEKGASRAAYRKGRKFYEKCCSHMVKNRSKKRSDKEIIAIARKFKTISEWARNNNGSYTSAWQRGLLAKCTAHMTRIERQPVVNVDSGKMFPSMTAAAKSINRTIGTLSQATKTGYKAGGYHWAYCDDNGNVLKSNNRKGTKK